MNSYPLLKLFACAVALMVLAVVLLGCQGYPRFNPTTCSTVELAGNPPRPVGLWVCE